MSARRTLINIPMLLSMLWFGFVGVAQAKLPDWVESPTPDTDTHLYSVGSSATLDLAKKAALVELAGKVNSRVQQLYQSKERAVNDQYTSWTSVDTEVEIGETDLRYFYVNQTEQIGNVYWVELVLDKTKMAQDLAARLTLEHGTLQTQMNALMQQSVFVQFLQAKVATGNIASVKQLIIQLQFFQQGFDASVYSEQYNAYLQTIQQAVAGNQVYLDASQAQPQVAALVRKWLGEQGVKLASTKTPETDVLVVSTEVSEFQDKRDAYNAEIVTTIRVDSAKQGQIGHATLQTKGRDYKRAEQAIGKAVKALKLRIQRQQPVDLLNIVIAE
ncbi:MAG: hypothetical protein GY770_17540 [Aestuariibacter sp.]|nr:hypothetical protein [Aestuariibacter sp.]